MSEKIQLGIVGLGDHCSKSHIKYLLEMEKMCEIRTLCDINPNLFQNLRLDLPETTTCVTKYSSILENPNIDAILIMTPDRFHTEQLVAAVEAGKHVFCEKPLATTQEEYKQLKEAFKIAKEKKLILTTCHPRRFDPPFDELKKYIRRNPVGLGKVLNFEFYFQYHKPSKKGLHTSLMFDHLNHEVDAMHYLFGKSKIKHAVKHYDNETAFHVSGVREDGISFSFIGQRKLEQSVYPEYMKVNFEEGFVTMDLHRGVFHIDTGTVYSTSQYNNCMTNYTKRFNAINRNFLQSILGTEKPYLTTEEMLINTKLAIDLEQNTFVEY